jgi:hypothetical protein
MNSPAPERSVHQVGRALIPPILKHEVVLRSARQPSYPHSSSTTFGTAPQVVTDFGSVRRRSASLRPQGRSLSKMRLSLRWVSTAFNPAMGVRGRVTTSRCLPGVKHSYAHPKLSCTTRAVTRREFVAVGSTNHASGRSSACVSFIILFFEFPSGDDIHPCRFALARGGRKLQYFYQGSSSEPAVMSPQEFPTANCTVSTDKCTRTLALSSAVPKRAPISRLTDDSAAAHTRI